MRDGTSRTEPDAPLDFACRASKEPNKFEPTSRLRGYMDEFRRFKAIYSNVPLVIMPNLRFLPVTRYRENTGDGRGSEGRGGHCREYSVDD